MHFFLSDGDWTPMSNSANTAIQEILSECLSAFLPIKDTFKVSLFQFKMIGWTNGPCTTKIAIANLIWPESGKWAPDKKSCIDDCLCSEKASDHFYLSLVHLGVHKACQYTENLRPIFLLVFHSWISRKTIWVKKERLCMNYQLGGRYSSSKSP